MKIAVTGMSGGLSGARLRRVAMIFLKLTSFKQK